MIRGAKIFLASDGRWARTTAGPKVPNLLTIIAYLTKRSTVPSSVYIAAIITRVIFFLPLILGCQILLWLLFLIISLPCRCLLTILLSIIIIIIRRSPTSAGLLKLRAPHILKIFSTIFLILRRITILLLLWILLLLLRRSRSACILCPTKHSRII